MRLTPRKRCEHQNPGQLNEYTVLIYKVLSRFVAHCPYCMLSGKYADDPGEALANFWKLDANLRKEIELEKPMSTEDYKRGVEDATVSLSATNQTGEPFATWFVEAVDKELTDRRKKLLTKKVTKWVNVYRGLPRFGYAALSTSENLYDTQEEATKQSQSRPGVLSIYMVGTYPIEIELPL